MESCRFRPSARHFRITSRSAASRKNASRNKVSNFVCIASRLATNATGSLLVSSSVTICADHITSPSHCHHVTITSPPQPAIAVSSQQYTIIIEQSPCVQATSVH